MKEIPGLRFGELIAFFVPGAVVVKGGTYILPSLATLTSEAISGEHAVVPALVLALAALAAGLVLSAIRELLENLALCNGEIHKRWAIDYNQLTPEKLAAFQTAVEQKYRYFQFAGNMALAVAGVFVARIYALETGCGAADLVLLFSTLLLLASACVQFGNSRRTIKDILSKGAQHGQEEGSQEEGQEEGS